MRAKGEQLLGAQDFDAEELLAGVVEWVELETPSERPDLIDRLLDRVEAQFGDLPVSIRRIPGRGGPENHQEIKLERYQPASGGRLPPE